MLLRSLADPGRDQLERAVPQRDRNRVLERAEIADPPGHARNAVDAANTSLLVGEQGGRDVAIRLQALDEDDRVLDRLRRTLTHVRRHRVRGVAKQRNAALDPAPAPPARDEGDAHAS